MWKLSISIGLAAGLVLAACGKDSGDGAPATTEGVPAKPGPGPTETAGAGAAGAGDADKARKKAWQYYMINCRTCHGETGRGDGPGAANLTDKPRDYSSPEWQKSVTDEQIKQILVKGGLALGKSALMQPRPELERKPEMLDALVAIIREFGEKE